jgi:hypothetical protein
MLHYYDIPDKQGNYWRREYHIISDTPKTTDHFRHKSVGSVFEHIMVHSVMLLSKKNTPPEGESVVRKLRRLLYILLILMAHAAPAGAKAPHHYVFFNMDRERISDPAFIETDAFEGAQVKYTWKQLEPEKDRYDFTLIREDLDFLRSKGKKLFIQL